MSCGQNMLNIVLKFKDRRRFDILSVNPLCSMTYFPAKVTKIFLRIL